MSDTNSPADVHQTGAPEFWLWGNFTVEQMERYWSDRSIVLWVSCFVGGILLWELVTSFPGEIMLYHIPVLHSFIAQARISLHSPSASSPGAALQDGSAHVRAPSFVLNPRRPTEINICTPEEDTAYSTLEHKETAGPSSHRSRFFAKDPPPHKVARNTQIADTLTGKTDMIQPNDTKHSPLHCRNGRAGQLFSARMRQLALSTCFFLLRIMVVPYVGLCFVLQHHTNHCNNTFRALILLHGMASVLFEVIVLLRVHVALLIFSPALATWLTPVLGLIIALIAALWIGQASVVFTLQLPIPIPDVKVGFKCHHFRMHTPTLITVYLLQYVAVVVMSMVPIFANWRVEGVVLHPVRAVDLVRMAGPRTGERPISVVRRQIVVDMARFFALSTVTHLSSVTVVATAPPGRSVRGLGLVQFPLQAFFMLAVVPRTILNIRQAFLESILPSSKPVVPGAVGGPNSPEQPLDQIDLSVAATSAGGPLAPSVSPAKPKVPVPSANRENSLLEGSPIERVAVSHASNQARLDSPGTLSHPERGTPNSWSPPGGRSAPPAGETWESSSLDARTAGVVPRLPHNNRNRKHAPNASDPARSSVMGTSKDLFKSSSKTRDFTAQHCASTNTLAGEALAQSLHGSDSSILETASEEDHGPDQAFAVSLISDVRRHSTQRAGASPSPSPHMNQTYPVDAPNDLRLH